MNLRARLRRYLRANGSRSGGRPARRLDYVFVVTYGRSGSTLVQGLLNTMPGVLVRGENGFYLLPLYRAAAQAQAFREQHLTHHPRKPSSAFYGLHAMNRRRFVASTRTLVTQTLLGDVPRAQVATVGFKEVLWHRVQPEETEGFFDFMDRAFPGARYVLNQRDHDQVLTSGFWQRHDSEEVLAALHRVEEMQQFLRETRPERVHDTRFELITGEDRAVADAALRDLAQFVVGRCDDRLLAALRETLATGHGPFAFGASRGRRKTRAVRDGDGGT